MTQKVVLRWEEKLLTEAAMTADKKFYIVHSTTCGSATSAGYVGVPLATCEEANAEAERLRTEEESKPTPETGLGSKVQYVVLGESEHECSVPGWTGACRQCHLGDGGNKPVVTEERKEEGLYRICILGEAEGERPHMMWSPTLRTLGAAKIRAEEYEKSWMPWIGHGDDARYRVYAVPETEGMLYPDELRRGKYEILRFIRNLADNARLPK